MLSLRIAVLFILLTTVLVGLHAADGMHSDGNMPYAGFQNRAIKSLSEQDMEELQSGGGWGLALPAELNGIPGPAHLLELGDEIGLSADQISEIETIYDEMKTEAVSAGKEFIEAEQSIEEAFLTGQLDTQELRALIKRSEAVRSELRFIHLSRHLKTPPLLTRKQIERYKVLRGYASDPCAKTPDGHNADLWKRHNNCE